MIGGQGISNKLQLTGETLTLNAEFTGPGMSLTILNLSRILS